MYSVSSDRLKERFTNLSLTDARKKAYGMLMAHPKSKAVVYVEDKGSSIEYISWTVMHCGKRFITRCTHMSNLRILRKDGTLGIRIKIQEIIQNKTLIGYRYYAGEEPKSGSYVTLDGKIRRD